MIAIDIARKMSVLDYDPKLLVVIMHGCADLPWITLGERCYIVNGIKEYGGSDSDRFVFRIGCKAIRKRAQMENSELTLLVPGNQTGVEKIDRIIADNSSDFCDSPALASVVDANSFADITEELLSGRIEFFPGLIGILAKAGPEEIADFFI